MELHRNGVRFCSILHAKLGYPEGVVFQFGDIRPLKVVDMFYLLVDLQPDSALGVSYSIFEGGISIPICIEGAFLDGDNLWLKCYVIVA